MIDTEQLNQKSGGFVILYKIYMLYMEFFLKFFIIVAIVDNKK